MGLRLAAGGSSARRGGFHIRPRNLAPPQSPRDDLRPKSRTCGLWPPKRACGRSASIVPYRGLRYRRKCGSPVGTDLPLIVGAGFIPPAGVCDAAGSGGVRAPRPTAARVAALVRFGRSFSVVCRGGPWPSRERPRHRRVPGTMQASSPTGVCCNAAPRFPGWPPCFPLFRRAGDFARRTSANSKNTKQRFLCKISSAAGVNARPTVQT